MSELMNSADLDLLNGLGHDAWSSVYPMPAPHQRELGEVALKAWCQLQHWTRIVQGFAAIDPADEAVRCVSCAGVAEPSEWTKWGGPPGNPDPPTPDMVFVAADAKRWHGFWHEPDCPWLLAWKQFHD